MAKKKTRRKEPRQRVEILSTPQRISRWGRDHKRTVMWASAGLVLLLLLSAAVLLYRAHREERARTLYAEASELLRSGQKETAIARLEKLLHDYGSTGVATDALLEMGDLYFQKGSYDRAAACYEDLRNRLSPESSLYFHVLENLGASYEAGGDRDAALKVYQRLAQEGPPVYRRQAQLYLGRVYEAAGDRQQAMSHYESYLSQNPSAPFTEMLRVRLARWRLAEPSSESSPESG